MINFNVYLVGMEPQHSMNSYEDFVNFFKKMKKKSKNYINSWIGYTNNLQSETF